MKRVFLILAISCCLVVVSSAPEEKGKFGGTFIGAIIAEDGIVMGSDSRSTFVDSAGEPMGYVDRMPKIYVRDGAAIAVAGLTSVEDELLSAFIRRHYDLLNSSVNEILFRNTNSVLMLSAGLANGEPLICAKVPVEPQSCRKSGYFANKNSPGLRRWYEMPHRYPVTTRDAAVALERAIREASDLDTTIGGYYLSTRNAP